MNDLTKALVTALAGDQVADLHALCESVDPGANPETCMAYYAALALGMVLYVSKRPADAVIGEVGRMAMELNARANAHKAAEGALS